MYFVGNGPGVRVVVHREGVTLVRVTMLLSSTNFRAKNVISLANSVAVLISTACKLGRNVKGRGGGAL